MARDDRPATAKVSRKPAEKREWHLVCVTRKGKVSMLQNLTLEMARETYKKLLPGTHPEKHFPPKCRADEKFKGDGKLMTAWPSGYYVPSCKSDRDRHGGCYVSYGSSHDREDNLERVDVLGPKGKELNPWAGVKPREVRHHCHCEPKKAAAPQPFMRPGKPRAETWRRTRTDFWNHPRLWDRVKDPRRQMCWEMMR